MQTPEELELEIALYHKESDRVYNLSKEYYLKILNHKSFVDLPDVYKDGLNNNYKIFEDQRDFYVQLRSQSFEKKKAACEKIFFTCINQKLLGNNTFFYYMFIGISVIADKKSMFEEKTAAVVYDSRYNNRYMIYNPDFILYQYKLGGLSSIEFIIIHEMSHIILGHIDFRNKISFSHNLFEDTAKIENIAQDLHINWNCAVDGQTILIPNICLPGAFPYQDFPTGLSSDEYLNILRKKDQSFINMMNLHDKSSLSTEHGMSLEDFSDAIEGHESAQGSKKGGHGSKKGPDFLEKIYDLNKIQDAYLSSKGQGLGNSTLLEKFIKTRKSKTNPEDILNFFLERANVICGKESSNRKLNKKNPYMHPGSKFIRQAEIAFFCDMSGSVSDELLADFFAIVKKCCEADREFLFVPFTTSVDSENIVTITSMVPPKLRTVCGGTDFSCINSYIKDMPNLSGVVVLTDLEAPYPGEIGIPRLWVTNHDSSNFNGENVLNFSQYK